ncbi:histidine kinase [Spirosoma taeanense]|uniref:Histidine kinase n=1 Tax=Spirosoma taeanense TaxID=2735870 RepID=A0A6M5Y3B7_9BACT|nr:histidine kinase [Spirosoma taeanense]QJW88319.1 histidine kinase [Spirosoma taeanense]
MTYETWVLVFLGMISAMLLYNIVQWLWYRERVYGLYTVYMLIWLGYFLLRNPASSLKLPDNVWYFVRTIGPMLAYFVYFEFTITFLGLPKKHPNLVRLLRYAQVALGAYVGLEAAFCFATELWAQPVHEVVHTAVRLMLTVLSGFIIVRIYQRQDLMARLFITGSLLLVLGGLTAMLLTLFWMNANDPDPTPFWRAPLTYLHIGIVFELLFFSLGLAYRHRREAIRQALVDKELAREREQRRREQAEAQLSVQQLRQEMIDMQMRALQSQISPHFLFNSLNSLSSLIADEPDRAEKFVDEMSSVYRYLLQSSDRELTTLAKELTFIQSYYHLLKTRYNRGIQLDIAIADPYSSYLLPPLTLQLLLENAVKHNIVSADRPLCIRIATDDAARLSVRNNLQRKVGSRSQSTQKGLLNITQKYKLLNHPDIQITETAEMFEVIIQLIRPA